MTTLMKRVERQYFSIQFDYAIMGDLMNHLKEGKFEISDKRFDKDPYMEVWCPKETADINLLKLKARMLKQPIEAISPEQDVPNLSIQELRTW